MTKPGCHRLLPSRHVAAPAPAPRDCTNSLRLPKSKPRHLLRLCNMAPAASALKKKHPPRGSAPVQKLRESPPTRSCATTTPF